MNKMEGTKMVVRKLNPSGEVGYCGSQNLHQPHSPTIRSHVASRRRVWVTHHTTMTMVQEDKGAQRLMWFSNHK